MAFFSADPEAIQSRFSEPLSQPIHDKLTLGVGVQRAKHTWRSPLHAAFEQTQIKKRVSNEFLLLPTANIIDICLHERMWTAMHRYHAKIETKWINEPSQHNYFLTQIAADAIQDGHKDPTKSGTSIEWNRSCARAAPQAQGHKSHESSLKWRPSSGCGVTCRLEKLTKSKTATNNQDE